MPTVRARCLPPSRRRARPAFVLLEVIIALLILSITVTAILRSFAQSFNAIKMLEVSTQASFFARQLMDEFEINPPMDDFEGGFGEEFIDFYFRVELLHVDPEYDDINYNENINAFFPMRFMTIEIFHDDGRHKARRVLLVDTAIMGFERFSIEHKRQFYNY